MKYKSKVEYAIAALFVLIAAGLNVPMLLDLPSEDFLPGFNATLGGIILAVPLTMIGLAFFDGRFINVAAWAVLVGSVSQIFFAVSRGAKLSLNWFFFDSSSTMQAASYIVACMAMVAAGRAKVSAGVEAEAKIIADLESPEPLSAAEVYRAATIRTSVRTGYVVGVNPEELQELDEPVAKPRRRAAAKPATKSATTTATKPATRPATKTAAKPTAKAPAKPAAKPAAKEPAGRKNTP